MFIIFSFIKQNRLKTYFKCHKINASNIFKGVCLEKAVAPHSNTLAWKIPWMEEPGGLQFMGLLKVGYD